LRTNAATGRAEGGCVPDKEFEWMNITSHRKNIDSYQTELA